MGERWTWVLPVTLKKLEEALPSEFVHRKIAVDDHSSDDTVKILKDFGWDVYPNPNSGISSGANYSLSKVDCPFFMSFEQDLLLANDWWPRLPELLDESDGAVASGVRFSTKPKAVHDLEKYVYRVYLMERCQKLRKNDFVVRDFVMRLKIGKRINLCEYKADSLADGLSDLFNREVVIPRIKNGKRQTIGTLINEEASLLAKFLRTEMKEWNPRQPSLQSI